MVGMLRARTGPRLAAIMMVGIQLRKGEPKPYDDDGSQTPDFELKFHEPRNGHIEHRHKMVLDDSDSDS